MEIPKILIIGTGAIGSFYSSILQKGGADISVMCRSDYQTVKEKGISIISTEHESHFFPKNVLKFDEKHTLKADYVLVATKVLPEIDTIALLKGSVAPESTIILLQNGINIEHTIQKAFPNNEIISALAFVCVNRISYGVTQHLDYGRLVLGTYPRGITPQGERLKALFEEGGINCELSNDVIAARWRKLLWNAPFNPISVLTGGADTREMTSHEPTIELAKEVMKEIHKLAAADGHELPSSSIEKNITDTHKMVPYKTSMLLDYEAGRPMEVEAILGNALTFAEDCKCATPHIKSLYCLLSLLNKKNQGKE